MEKYKRLRLLGHSGHSKVYLVQDTELDELCVVKQLEASFSGHDRDAAMREVALLNVLHHPSIVGYREAFMTRVGNVCLIMEYAEGGDLHQFLCEHRRDREGAALPEMLLLGWLAQLSDALRYLHSLNVLHRDVKPQNIVLRRDGMVQLADFGISAVLRSCERSANASMGTPCYASPERMRRRPYGTSADIWSLGVVFYELCALRRPFDGSNLNEVSKAILEGYYEPLEEQCFSQELRDLVYEMLSPEPEDRPSAAEILKFPLLSEALSDPIVEDLDRLHEMQQNQPPERDADQTAAAAAAALAKAAATAAAAGLRLNHSCSTRSLFSAGLQDSSPDFSNPGVYGCTDQVQEVPDVEVLSTGTRSIPSREAQHCPKLAWGGNSTDALGDNGAGDPVAFHTEIQPAPEWDDCEDRAIDHQHKGFGQAILHGARLIFGRRR